MNMHMTRRLEVLAKEIAAKKSPKVDDAANRIFAEAGAKSDAKTTRDWKISKPLRTVDDVISDPTADKGDSDGWIEWSGGKRPIAGDVRIEVRYGDGKQDDCRTFGPAGSWGPGWGTTCQFKNRITAYRVVS